MKDPLFKTSHERDAIAAGDMGEGTSPSLKKGIFHLNVNYLGIKKRNPPHWGEWAGVGAGCAIIPPFYYSFLW